MTQANPFNPAQAVDEFDLMRKRLKARGAVRGEEATRTAKRTAASLGNLPSGAAIKTQQLAQQSSDRLLSEDIQGVNIAEAAFDLQTLSGQQSADLQETIGKQRWDELGLQGEQSMDQIRAKGASDMEIAILNGATQTDIATMQVESQEKLHRLTETGMNRRFAIQLSENKRLFDLEQGLRQQGFDLQEEVFKNTQGQQEEQMAMDKFATVVNTVDLLKSFGVELSEMGVILENLDLELSMDIVNALVPKEKREADIVAQRIKDSALLKENMDRING